MATRGMWTADYVQRDLRLTHFRGDNAYVWQFRNVRSRARAKYFAYLKYLSGIDQRQLLHRLEEDGLFGCWIFDYPGWPTVSRDLLDSVNELYFLDRHTGILRRPGMSVLDIGAGYGRLAWRALSAAPELGSYICVDAVPESTFICEYYLRFRACTKAEVVPLYEVDERLASRTIDLAVNIHSFSEMTREAVNGWIERLAALRVPRLLIVPNDYEAFLTTEVDGSHLPFDQVLAAHGYALAVKEPVVPGPLRRSGLKDHFFLFELNR